MIFFTKNLSQTQCIKSIQTIKLITGADKQSIKKVFSLKKVKTPEIQIRAKAK